MKRYFILLICLLDFVSLTFAQTKDSLKNKDAKEISLDFCVVKTNLLSNGFYGFNIDMKYFPINRIGTGVYFSSAKKLISDTFTYSISKPVIDYGELGWIIQYNFLQTEKVRMDINLNNGFSIATLSDDAIKERRGTTRTGSPRYVSKEIATNNYYLIEPGVDFSFKLSFNHNRSSWVTTKAKYRFLFGDSKYGTTKQFSGYLFAIGISLIEYTTKTKHTAK